jgi:hypothetical protein
MTPEEIEQIRQLLSHDIGEQAQARVTNNQGGNSTPRNAGHAAGRGFATGGSGGLGAAQLAALMNAGGGDPAMRNYIAQTLGQWRGPYTYNLDKRAAAFNPPGANIQPGVGGHGSARTSGGAIQQGSFGMNLNHPSQQYQDRYNDERSARNRQTSLNQDFSNEQRMNNERLRLLHQIMGGVGGRNSTSMREEVFNNAGGPQVMQLHSQQSFSPQDLLQFLMR